MMPTTGGRNAVSYARRCGLLPYVQSDRAYTCVVHGIIDGSAAIHVRYDHPAIWEKSRLWEMQ